MGEEGGEGGREGGENSDDREKSCQQENEQGQGRKKNIRRCPVNRKDGWEKRRKRGQAETGRAISNIFGFLRVLRSSQNVDTDFSPASNALHNLRRGQTPSGEDHSGDTE